MKKIICAVFILFALFMTFTGCNSDKETYTVEKVMIDVTIVFLICGYLSFNSYINELQ